jgi:hypothetical protein
MKNRKILTQHKLKMSKLKTKVWGLKDKARDDMLVSLVREHN